MVSANLHTHCRFCDGTGEPEEYVSEALKQGFSAIGFSSHAPLPFFVSFVMKNDSLADYCASIRVLKQKYHGQLEIYLGLEVDYVPGVVGPASPQFTELGLDYTIGSVHLIRNGKSGEFLGVDDTYEKYERLLCEVFDGEMARFGTRYFSLIRSMLEEHRPTIVGHLDLLKKLNRGNKYFAENELWYRAEIAQTLTAIAKAGSILEVNTGGMSRGYTDIPYPSPWILAEAKKLGIPVTITSDAHQAINLSAYYDLAMDILKDAGYRRQTILQQGQWVGINL